ncbi:DUF2993 domain-containing protein [Actinopolyspora erythraea]|uniref:DUF2993 domain-containing protein n=1 Tax=Actinopolyspora erythraea TaxID=414996 RepID=A0A099DAU9_9ACTN|nr:DUF2993 domain-containing protein [Actinopolyspora erythraea]ASU80443.1 DUF2993 domain-containing protein [Actinopolyspora erythraea]KGI82887.1 hypothetical protein IL38_03225 [Actinopolyspora erythraea]
MRRAFPFKKFTITLVVLLGLLLAADFGAAAAAEYQVSKKMGEKLEGNRDPGVRITGFPFLTQAARGDFRDVRLRVPDVDVGPLRDVDVRARLHHARLSTFGMLTGGSSRIRVEEVTGSVRIDESDLDGVLPVRDLRITPAEGSDASAATAGGSGGDSSTRVRMRGKVDIAGTTNRVAVTGGLHLRDGELRIVPDELELDNSAVGRVDLAGPFEKAILRQFDTSVDPGGMPFDVRPTAVRVERGALVVAGTAENVIIDGDGVGG